MKNEENLPCLNGGVIILSLLSSQFKTYFRLLKKVEPERTLFLAIPIDAYTDFFNLPFGKEENLKIIVCNPKLKTLELWLRNAKNHQDVVKKAILKYADFQDDSREESEVQPVFDEKRNHYFLMDIGWKNMHRIHACLLHIDIKNEKIGFIKVLWKKALLQI
ncbi:MAG: hypothetical protein ACI9XO_003290 [Paraglaciecola sp.]